MSEAEDRARPEPDVEVEDITYAGDVAAWLVRPAETEGDGADRRHAGILLWHWLSTEEPIGTRDEFLDEARALAGAGAVCLLPQGRFPWTIPPSGSQADTDQIEAEVARLARGLDLLAARPDVDAGRLAVVGHDFGAMLAVIAAARDARIRALALIAPTPRWADWFLPFWPIDEPRLDYLRATEPLDPIEQMAALPPRPVLLQMARRDFYVPVMAGYELRASAGDDGSASIRLETYDAEHDMTDPSALADRTAFLAEALGLAGESERSATVGD
jgi:dienelactone hydrolase